MNFVTHAATGAAIGRLVQRPAGGFAAGLVSHAVLDMLPHHDYQRTVTGVIDFGLGLLFLLACGFSRSSRTGYWAILGATIPDLEVALSQFGVISEEDLKFPTHGGLLPHVRAPRIVGALLQAALILLSVYVLA